MNVEERLFLDQIEFSSKDELLKALENMKSNLQDNAEDEIIFIDNIIKGVSEDTMLDDYLNNRYIGTTLL